MLDNNQQYKVIRRVATKARAFLFEHRNKLYNGVPNHLGGLCGYATSILHNKLSKEGLDPEMVQGSGHWFIKCGVWLVDITASQFGQGKICIRNYNKVQEIIKSQDRAMLFWHQYKISKRPEDMGMGANEKFIEERIGIKAGDW